MRKQPPAAEQARQRPVSFPPETEEATFARPKTAQPGGKAEISPKEAAPAAPARGAAPDPAAPAEAGSGRTEAPKEGSVPAGGSLLAGLDLFSEDWDDEDEALFLPPAAAIPKTPRPAAAAGAAKAGPPVPEPASAQKLLAAGTVLRSMEEGLADLMDLDYAPDPDEILIQRREFEGRMYDEPAPADDRMPFEPPRKPLPAGLSAGPLMPGGPRSLPADPAPGTSRPAMGPGEDRRFALRVDLPELPARQPERDSRFALSVDAPEPPGQRPGESGRFAMDAAGPEPGAPRPGRDGPFDLRAPDPRTQERVPERDSRFDLKASAPGLAEQAPERDSRFDLKASVPGPGEQAPKRDSRFDLRAPASAADGQGSMRSRRFDLNTVRQIPRQSKPDRESRFDLNTVRQSPRRQPPERDSRFDLERRPSAAPVLRFEPSKRGKAEPFDRRGGEERKPEPAFASDLRLERRDESSSGLTMDNGSVLAQRSAERDAERLSLEDRERKKQWEL